MNYQEFIDNKKIKINNSGFVATDLNPLLKDFQKFTVQKALKRGRCALFFDCGLGKTFMQLEWARCVAEKTNKPVLILCPLSVSGQTIQEGVKFKLKQEVKKYSKDIKSLIYISNYEQLDNIDCSIFSGVVLDESSIIKDYSGSIKKKIIESFAKTPYKLACTATPSPNDEIEIGNHSEFLNVMSSVDMVAKFFTTEKNRIHGNKYRLKKHAEKDFYRWIKTWAIVCGKPSDLGNFDDTGYELPKLEFIEHRIETEKQDNGKLINDISVNAMSFNEELRRSMTQRLEKTASIAKNTKGQIILWIKQNVEGELLKKMLPEAVEVKGNDTPEFKEKTLLGFANNEFRILITKQKIAQYGLNLQNCNTQVFASLDFSFEGLYQAIRRSYRFGQQNEVTIHLITTDTMQNVIKSINEKKGKFEKMRSEIICCEDIEIEEVEIEPYQSKEYQSEKFKLINGDCVEEIKKIPSESVDFSFFSPPFGALYVFSDNPRDMSNVANDDEFYKHFEFLLPELFRILKKGRKVSIHVMQSTTLKGRDGYYSIKDFRGDLIRLFQKHGFYFHAENMIRKDPKTAAIRTKNRQLMWGQTKKDSLVCRPGLADYILHFEKPGESEVPVQNDLDFDYWCMLAEPIWMDIIESDTLPTQKGLKDERHITATQLKPIQYCLDMYCNKGETVFSPYSGIGSEGYMSVLTKRNFIGIELNENYYNQSITNIKVAEQEANKVTLFDMLEV